MTKIVLIGAGNVGYHLGVALSELPDIMVIQIFSRTEEKAKNAAKKINCSYTTQINQISQNGDLYILAVHDTAIAKVAESMGQITALKNKLLVHTSGATPSTALFPHFSNIGIFYPLQTFSISKQPDFKNIPFCLDAKREADYLLLKNIADQLSDRVERIDDQQRSVLHVAAVFVNNFTNYLYTVGAEITEKENVPFDLLKPLILETALKIQDKAPRDMQTGPAARGDQATINRHQQLLEEYPDFKNLYAEMTKRIMDLGDL